MDAEEKTTVVFRDDAERQDWWKMLMTVSQSDSLVFDEAVEWTDNAVRALRNRSTPDINVTPAEANDLYAAGYQPNTASTIQVADAVWVKRIPSDSADAPHHFIYDGVGRHWAKRTAAKRFLSTATWDPSKQSLAAFLRESEAAT